MARARAMEAVVMEDGLVVAATREVAGYSRQVAWVATEGAAREEGAKAAARENSPPPSPAAAAWPVAAMEVAAAESPHGCPQRRS